MMRKIVLLLFVSVTLWANRITPSEVYAESMIIRQHVEFLLDYYKIMYNPEEIAKRTRFTRTKFQPRNVWQRGYELLVKINILRESHGLSRIEPVGMEPVEKLNPDMVYGQTQRVLAELRIFEVRLGIKVPHFTVKKFYHKTPSDVYNSLTYISALFDQLNHSELSPSYVFAEAMRIYDDLTMILQKLNIKDNTIPTVRKEGATPSDSMKRSILVLESIQRLQRDAGIESIDFSELYKKEASPSDVYTIIGIILAELQPIKAYVGLTNKVTPSAIKYNKKVPADIEQLMGWNLRKLSLISSLRRR